MSVNTTTPCLAGKSFGRVHWACTEPLGHDGPHEATADDGGIFAVWPREDVDAALAPPAPYRLPAAELTGVTMAEMAAAWERNREVIASAATSMRELTDGQA